RALDMANTGPLRLLTGCQTPHAIRRAGVTRLAMALNEHVVELDKLIEDRFREHELADIVLSVPGIGTTLGAEFLAAVGGSLDRFDFPDALAAFADVAAVKAHGRIDVCSLFPPAPTV
ncbi:transposase, partial [Streptomyces sp. NPDC088090]|uniref:transposase n=1 Tax=Streptomyces sp. NPDC088090 TaxID=3365822 RepID=UPI00384DF2DD